MYQCICYTTTVTTICTDAEKVIYHRQEYTSAQNILFISFYETHCLLFWNNFYDSRPRYQPMYILKININFYVFMYIFCDLCVWYVYLHFRLNDNMRAQFFVYISKLCHFLCFFVYWYSEFLNAYNIIMWLSVVKSNTDKKKFELCFLILFLFLGNNKFSGLWPNIFRIWYCND